MGFATPIFYTLGHRIRLVPDDVLPQIPPVRLQREGDAPGDADEVFGLEADYRGKGEPSRIGYFVCRVCVCGQYPQHPIAQLQLKHSTRYLSSG